MTSDRVSMTVRLLKKTFSVASTTSRRQASCSSRAGAEFDRHPIIVPPWRAQSGASLAKGYIRAFGVAPRSVLQPDFSKEHQGIAASTYFGGRVECRIVGEPMPVMYIDAVSMYPAVFDLLDLWFTQVIPQRLEPVDIDPQEIEALLAALREKPTPVTRSRNVAAPRILRRGRS